MLKYSKVNIKVETYIPTINDTYRSSDILK